MRPLGGTGDAVRRHEVRRFLIAAPILVPTLSLTVTIAARWTGLRAWPWDLVAIPVLALLTAAGGLGVQLAAEPLLARRHHAGPPAALRAGVRYVATLAILSLLLRLAGPALVRAGVWWTWFPAAIPVGVAAVGLAAVTVVALYDRLYFRLLASFEELERRRSLERFLPREAVDRVLAGGGVLEAGERRIVTILFAVG